MSTRSGFFVCVVCSLIFVMTLACGTSTGGKATDAVSLASVVAPSNRENASSAIRVDLFNNQFPAAKIDGVPSNAKWVDFSQNETFQNLARSLESNARAVVMCLTDGQVGYICHCQIVYSDLPANSSIQDPKDTLSTAFGSIQKEITWLDPSDFPAKIQPSNVEELSIALLTLPNHDSWILSVYRIPDDTDHIYILASEFTPIFSIEEAWRQTSDVIQASITQK